MPRPAVRRKPEAGRVPKRPVPIRPNRDEELAARCAELQMQVLRAGRSLHDQAGPLLSAAGIHLQLMKLDHPAAARQIEAVTGILEEALVNVREVSQELASSPVFRGGLERALERLAEEVAVAAPVDIVIDYEAPGGLSREISVAVYEAVAAVVRAAVLQGGATEVEISIRHKGSLSAKVTDNGRSAGRAQALSTARLLAEQYGLRLEIATGKSTIVSIRAYALRRSAG